MSAFENGMADERLLAHTTSLCATCKTSLAAELWESGGRVELRKHCPEHGRQSALVASDSAWYQRVIREAPSLQPATPLVPVTQGCPYDCGPCSAHQQRLHLPVVPITSACNLDCPICYTHNRNDHAYHMGAVELQEILRTLRKLAPEARIINLTGGEPTQHPNFLELVELCRREGVHRITISTHGLQFLKDERLLESLAALDARIVLSFDSFREEANRQMLGGDVLGAKMRVLRLLEKHGVATTLLAVLARGQNDEEVAAFVELALNKDFIRSVEFHPMTFTGYRGATFDRAARYTTFDALSDLQRQSQGRLRIDDFVSAPAAHPLCYQVTYLLRLPPDGKDEGARWLPFPRFMQREALRRLLSRGLYMEPGPEEERVLREIIDDLWTRGDPASEDVLMAMRGLLDDAFTPSASAADRLDRAERHTKAIYIHSHMDEETFDTDRIRQCCVGMPGPDGRNIPSCAYNVLYRERNPRFSSRPATPLVQLGRGRV